MPEVFHTAVVGSGPAGLMAAGACSAAGKSTVLFERLPRTGTKLLASGGGKCNFSNTLSEEEFMLRFGREGRFMTSALRAFPNTAWLAFLRNSGVPYCLPDGFHYFPVSERSSDVLNALAGNARRNGTVFKIGEMVRSIRKTGDFFELETGAGIYHAEKVILACGGTAWRGLGGTDSGLRLAESLGHTVQEPFPAMAPLLVREKWVGELAGISLPDSKLQFGHGRRIFANCGELLFTHKGFSGPCALDLAGNLAEECARKGDQALLFLPDAAGIAKFGPEFFSDLRKKHGTKMIHTVLSASFPKALAVQLCRMAGAEECRCCELSGEMCGNLMKSLTEGVPLTAYGAGPMECAMAMQGGVKLREIHPETLESRIVPGLYFAGELMNLTGPCGGYNIRWAAASGFLAGSSAGRC